MTTGFVLSEDGPAPMSWREWTELEEVRGMPAATRWLTIIAQDPSVRDRDRILRARVSRPCERLDSPARLDVHERRR